MIFASIIAQAAPQVPTQEQWHILLMIGQYVLWPTAYFVVKHFIAPKVRESIKGLIIDAVNKNWDDKVRAVNANVDEGLRTISLELKKHVDYRFSQYEFAETERVRRLEAVEQRLADGDQKFERIEEGFKQLREMIIEVQTLQRQQNSKAKKN